MEAALYGRMNLGKCVATDYGYVGCKGECQSDLQSRGFQL